MKEYFYLKSKSPHGVELGSQLEKNANLFCDRCYYRLRDFDIDELVVDETDVTKCPLSHVLVRGIILVRLDFLQELNFSKWEHDLKIVPVKSEKTGKLTQYAACWGKEPLIVRGSQGIAKNGGKATSRRCDVCGRECYSTLKYEYLYPSPIEDRDIYQATNTGLIVSRAVIDTLNPSFLKKLYIIKLEVLDHPLDGLEELTTIFPGKKA